MGETGETGESRCRFLPISTRRIIVHVVGAPDVMNLKVSGEVPVGKQDQQTQAKIPWIKRPGPKKIYESTIQEPNKSWHPCPPWFSTIVTLFYFKKNDVSLILRHLKFKDTSMVAVNGSLFLFSGVLVDVCNDFLHPALISPSGSFSRWKSEEWQFPSWSWQRKTWTWENQAKTKHNKWSETGADYELREEKRWDYWWNVACTWRCIPDEAWKMGHHFLTRISSWRKSMEGSWFLPQTGRSCPRKEES